MIIENQIVSDEIWFWNCIFVTFWVPIIMSIHKIHWFIKIWQFGFFMPKFKTTKGKNTIPDLMLFISQKWEEMAPVRQLNFCCLTWAVFIKSQWHRRRRQFRHRWLFLCHAGNFVEHFNAFSFCSRPFLLFCPWYLY